MVRPGLTSQCHQTTNYHFNHHKTISGRSANAIEIKRANQCGSFFLTQTHSLRWTHVIVRSSTAFCLSVCKCLWEGALSICTHHERCQRTKQAHPSHCRSDCHSFYLFGWHKSETHISLNCSILFIDVGAGLGQLVKPFAAINLANVVVSPSP